MMKFNVSFDGFSGVVEASSINEAKKVFAKGLIADGKTEMRNVLMVMNKITAIAEPLPVVGGNKRGRKVNPNSARQIKMRERAEALEAGIVFRRGRKVDPNSANQKKLAERAAKLEAGTLRRGRPVDPNSARQLKMKARAEAFTSTTMA